MLLTAIPPLLAAINGSDRGVGPIGVVVSVQAAATITRPATAVDRAVLNCLLVRIGILRVGASDAHIREWCRQPDTSLHGLRSSFLVDRAAALWAGPLELLAPPRSARERCLAPRALLLLPEHDDDQKTEEDPDRTERESRAGASKYRHADKCRQ